MAKELYSRQSPSKAMEELGYRMITATRRGEAGVTEELIQNMLTSDVGDSLEIRATVKPKFDVSLLLLFCIHLCIERLTEFDKETYH